MPCFYVPHLTNGVKNATIEGEEFHHLINVFRKRKGDEIQLPRPKRHDNNADETNMEKIITRLNQLEM